MIHLGWTQPAPSDIFEPKSNQTRSIFDAEIDEMMRGVEWGATIIGCQFLTLCQQPLEQDQIIDQDLQVGSCSRGVPCQAIYRQVEAQGE
jgi:hypothetical protein